MQGNNKEEDRPQVKLTNVIIHLSTFTIVVFAFVCYYFLGVKEKISQIFVGFAIVNSINWLLFQIHKKLNATYLLTSILIFLSAFLISLYSGGIRSPFIFVLPVVVMSGFVMNQRYGRIWLIVVLLSIAILYCLPLFGVLIENYVPSHSIRDFSLLSIVLATLILGGVYGNYMARSNSKILNAKKELEGRTHEKEIMLKEIHHRVKNNMQLITSLLGLQSANIENEEVKDLLMQSQFRIQAMAMIHEMLYHTDDLTRIPYDRYVIELMANLTSEVKAKEHYIDLKIDVPELYLNIDTAIPLGLIINEIITNSLKYAFVKKKQGCIYLSLKKNDSNNILLEIGDDGIGFDNSINSKTSKSLGLKLIESLTRQLGGSVEKLPFEGTNYRIQLKEIGR